jgi:HlyD family secretion protein
MAVGDTGENQSEWRVIGWIKRHKTWSVVIAAAVALGAYAIFVPAKPTYEYVTETIGRGDVISKVTASGKLRALNTVKVGAEVSGQIISVNVDFNSPVTAGQVLAIIDPTRFRAREAQAKAQVSLAQASLAQADAAVTRARTDLDLQQRDYARRRQLLRDGFVSKAGLDTATGQLAGAQAGLRTAVAQVSSARAQIQQSSAELTNAQLDLRRTVIVAPTSGVIINKLVEPGSTVAASFQTPNLFEIAADTTRMQVEASVDEADIGQIADGQAVEFTVDAYPEIRFPASVRQIRKAATETQNVVSYFVILEVNNADGKLLPGMTANVDIITGTKKNVLRVPSQALRFRPKIADRPKANAEDTTKGDKAREDTANQDKGRDKKPPQSRVFLSAVDVYKPAAKVIQIGVAGDEFTEVISGLKAGDKVLVRSRSLEEKKPSEDGEEEESDDSSSS